MNRDILLNYLHKPAVLSGASLAALENLTHTYPFAAFTHLLYIKALAEQDSIHYHEKLKFTAAHVADRSVLYYLLNGPSAGSDRRTGIPVPALQTHNSVAKPTLEDDPAKISTESGFDALIDKVRDLAARSLPDFSGIPEKLQQLQEEHRQRALEIAQAYLGIRERTEASLLEATKQEHVVPAETEENKDELSGPKAGLSNETEPNSLVAGQPAEKKQELIEKFIETAPSMPKPKKEFFSAVNMAQSSTVDRDDLVSETLATIFLRQGNIPKALKIYQRLSLIIPEKSAYFAALIEKIKRENNLL